MKTSRMIHALIVLITTQLFAVTVYAEEPLMPDQAFIFKADVVNENTVRATWTIAKDYYLYRDKVRFESATPGITLGTVAYPAGKQKMGLTPEGKEGLVEAYFKQLQVDIPLNRTDPKLTTLKLVGHSQGCSEKFGICYPPQKREISLTLPVLKQTAPKGDSGALESLSNLRSNLGLNTADTPLPAEEAFQVKALLLNDNTIQVIWTIAPDTYMYRDKIFFESATDGVELGKPDYPPGKKKFGITPEGKEGEVDTYSDQVAFNVPFSNKTGQPINMTLIAHGQGCAEKFGICYPPQKRPISLEVPASPSAASLDTWDIAWRLLIAFGSGFLLTFTPCVLPMLPILGSIIIGQGKDVSRARCAGLSSTYVLGTTLVWTLAGVVAGATGQQLQAYTSHPYFVVPVAVILVLLSLAMFGLYNLQMPASLQSRAQEKSSSLRSGSYIGVFLMGVLGSIIAGACVSPILILNLGVALDTQSPVLGGAIMFLMAIGMGIPIILIGIGAGWLLPRAGGWMDTVKYAFGVILIGLAIYVVTPVKSIPVMYLWSALLIATGAAMGMFQKTPFPSRVLQAIWKLLAVLFIVWGGFAFISALQGNRDILSNPIPTQAPVADSDAKSLFIRVITLTELEKHLAEAKVQGKPAMLDYYATWCTDCNIMARTVFADSEVQAVLRQKFVLIKADVTDQFDPNIQPMKDKFGVFGPPAMLFFDTNGAERKDLRRYGKMSKEDFLDLIKPLL